MEINKLVQIHNELCAISVKGEDTITMAKCLIALREIIEESQKEDKENV